MPLSSLWLYFASTLHVGVIVQSTEATPTLSLVFPLIPVLAAARESMDPLVLSMLR